MDIVAPGNRAPDVRLTDEAGATRALSEWRGRSVAVTFTYTRCPLPDFCPRMDRQFQPSSARFWRTSGCGTG